MNEQQMQMPEPQQAPEPTVFRSVLDFLSSHARDGVLLKVGNYVQAVPLEEVENPKKAWQYIQALLRTWRKQNEDLFQK